MSTEVLEETRRLVACYMDEGEAELAEEDEYKELCQKPKDKRTAEEEGRLRDLARMIPYLLNSVELREMVRKAWNRKDAVCPYCDVNLVTDFHLKNCPLGVVLGEAVLETKISP